MSNSPQPRATTEDEWPALRNAVNRVFRPAGGDLTADCPLLFGADNRHHLRVLVDEPGQASGAIGGLGADAGDVIAHAGWVTRDARVGEETIRTACIGAVFTIPGRRQEGLGSRIFADVLACARAHADLVMVSGDRGLYRRHGLEPAPALARFVWSSSHGVSAAPPGGDAGAWRPATRDDLKDLAALYDAEDVHFVRSASDWSRLWDAGHLMDVPVRVWMVVHAGNAVGYLAVQDDGARPGIAAHPRRILELAGERDALLAAAPSVADELLVPGHDARTIGACELRGWLRSAWRFPITVQVLTDRVRAIPWYGLNYV